MPAEQAPRRPRVAEVDEFKETVHHRHRFAIEGKFLNYEPLCKLIQRKCQQGDKEDPGIVNGGLGRSHSPHLTRRSGRWQAKAAVTRTTKQRIAESFS